MGDAILCRHFGLQEPKEDTLVHFTCIWKCVVGERRVNKEKLL